MVDLMECILQSHLSDPVEFSGYMDQGLVNCQMSLGIPPSPTHALVNFLVPRGQFLASPFGQAVLLNSEVPGAGSLGPEFQG